MDKQHLGSIYFISPVAYGMNPVFMVVGTLIFRIQHLGLGRSVVLMAAFLLPVTTLTKNWWWDMYWMDCLFLWEKSFQTVTNFHRSLPQFSCHGSYSRVQLQWDCWILTAWSRATICLYEWLCPSLYENCIKYIHTHVIFLLLILNIVLLLLIDNFF